MDALTGTPVDPEPPAETTHRLTRRQLLALVGVGAVGAAGGGVLIWDQTRSSGTAATPGKTSTAAPTTPSATLASGFLTSDAIHTLSLTIDTAAYTTMLETYRRDSTKEWLEADVVLDGTTYQGAGVRLKGNSSLKSVSTDAKPETLPWLVRLDKFTDGVSHGGLRELVVRSNSTTTALNEAVALDLLAAGGLASQQAASLRFRVNNSSEVLRLAVENPADEWVARVFAVDGLLFKAEAGGDYSYRGTDASSYDDIFDVEAGDDDLGPLIDFLDFVNNASDADFASGLAARLDVDAFARYLAFEALIDNFDDIDGPGNNSYLWWDRGTESMTVVAWDHNLAFGARPGGGAGQGGMPDRQPGAVPGGAMPSGFQPPEGADDARGQGMAQGGRGGIAGKANALVTRFTSLADGTARVADATTALKAQLFSDAVASKSLQSRSELIAAQASDLVSADVLAGEKQAVATYFA